MNVDISLQTVARLVAIKREELEHHRVDLLRLQHILCNEAVKLKEAEEIERSFVNGMRVAEAGNSRLDASVMIESRRYLLVLQNRIEEQQRAFDEVEALRSSAQGELDRLFVEVRALEMLAERRKASGMRKEQRIAYLHADDQEITRVANGRSEHVAD